MYYEMVYMGMTAIFIRTFGFRNRGLPYPTLRFTLILVVPILSSFLGDTWGNKMRGN